MDADEGLWSELPDDVVGNIQARLPLMSLVRSRAVCKGWNAAMASPWLLKQRMEAQGGERDCMLCVVGFRDMEMACCAYDRPSDRWYQLHLPPWLNLDDGKKLVLPVVSAGGNVMVSAMYDQELPGPITAITVTLDIGNPVADSWTHLPNLPGGLMIQDVLGVFQDAQAGCFKLVALDDTPRYEDLKNPVRTYIYDSALGSWSETVSVLPGDDFVNYQSDQGTFVGRVLYCVAGWGNLLAYNLDQGTWSSLQVAKPDFVKTLCCNVINVQERMLCVALGSDIPAQVTRERRGICNSTRRRGIIRSSSVQIWELDFKHLKWRNVAVMPPDMFINFRNLCFPMGQFLFDDPSRIRKPPGWRWLPPCPYNKFEGKSIYRLDPWLEYI